MNCTSCLSSHIVHDEFYNVTTTMNNQQNMLREVTSENAKEVKKLQKHINVLTDRLKI
jgi:uncharacterized membrane protein YfhO